VKAYFIIGFLYDVRLSIEKDEKNSLSIVIEIVLFFSWSINECKHSLLLCQEEKHHNIRLTEDDKDKILIQVELISSDVDEKRTYIRDRDRQTHERDVQKSVDYFIVRPKRKKSQLTTKLFSYAEMMFLSNNVTIDENMSVANRLRVINDARRKYFLLLLVLLTTQTNER
jgi:hypothetical protein